MSLTAAGSLDAIRQERGAIPHLRLRWFWLKGFEGALTHLRGSIGDADKLDEVTFALNADQRSKIDKARIYLAKIERTFQKAKRLGVT